MSDENPFREIKSSEEVFEELSEQFQRMDDVDALEIQRHLLTNSPVVQNDDGKSSVAHLTLAQKFLEITREEKRIEKRWDEYTNRLDPDDFPDHAHPQRIAAIGQRKEKRRELADNIILLFSLAQEVIDQYMVRLCAAEIADSEPCNFDQTRSQQGGEVKQEATMLRDVVSESTDAERTARQSLSRMQREKYLYYLNVVDKPLHDRLKDIRTNIRNSLIHNIDDHHTLDPIDDIERDCRDCIGVINRLSKMEQDEIAIPISHSSGDSIIFHP